MSKTCWLGVVVLAAASVASLGTQTAMGQRVFVSGTGSASAKDKDKDDDNDHKDRKRDKDKNKQDNDKNNKSGNADKSDNSNGQPQFQPFIHRGKNQNDRDKDDRDDNKSKQNGSNKFFGPNQPGFPGGAGSIELANKKLGYWKGDTWQGTRKIDNWVKVFGNNQQPFSSQWYKNHPQAWKWDNNRSNVWAVATVPGVYSWLGWGSPPPQYGNFGNFERFDPSRYGEWYPLGVFSLMTGGDDVGTRVVQLAVDRRGRIAGNYFDMITDSNHSISGQVDRRSQRVEFWLNKNQFVRFRASIMRLLQPYGTMTVRLPGGEQRWQFVRLEN